MHTQIMMYKLLQIIHGIRVKKEEQNLLQT